nr:reverse transcriptase domain-containing protein [Tanacetum cinerariifolium]
MLPATQINTFYNGLTFRHRDTINAAAGGTFMKSRLEECYDLIKNMTTHHNDWNTSAQQSESSSSITSSSDIEIATLKTEMAKINKNLIRILQVNQNVKAVTPNCETCGGPHSYTDCSATVGQTQNVYAVEAYQGTLLCNTITNPKEDLKGITTRSRTTYQEPTIPTTSTSLPKVVEHETEVTKDMVPPTNNGSTKDVQPLVVQTVTLILNSKPIVAPIIEPVVAPVSAPKPNQKPSIPYTSRFHDQKLNDKLLLPELYPTYMTLKLTDRLMSHPVGVAEDVFVKVGKFYFLSDFVVVDFDVDPQVPLILGGSFLKTRRALIDVFERELTLRVGKEAITFNLDQTLRYSANYNDMTANRIDVIDMACEEYLQEVLCFSDVIAKVDTFLALEDDPTSPEVDQSYVDTEGDILLFEAFLNDDPSLPPPNQGNYMPQGDDKLPVIIAKDWRVKTALITVLKSHKRAIAWKLSDLKDINPKFCTHKILMEEDFEPVVQHQRRVNLKIHDVIKKEVLKLLDAGLIYPISDSAWCEDTNLCLNWEKSHFMVKEGIVLGHKISKNGIEVDKAKVDIIAKLPHPTTVKGAVLGQRQEKHFRPLHYASKIMTEAESNYTTTEIEMLAMVYAFEKFRSYLIMNKSIVYTDHSALKYLFAKKDSKARLLRWVLFLQEFVSLTVLVKLASFT